MEINNLHDIKQGSNVVYTPQISVLLPVHNTKEQYLRESIESILTQTYTDFELLVINDASTEEHVVPVISSYLDSRIVYCYSDKKNIASALNIGIHKARGKYIARMDSDDIAYPERLEKQIDYLENNPHISLVGTGVTVVKLQGRSWGRSLIRIPEEHPTLFELLHGCPFIHPTVMWRKADFERHNLYYDENYRYCEDHELWYRVIRCLETRNLQEPLLTYRKHSDSVSRQYHSIQMQGTAKVRQRILDFCTDDMKMQDTLRELLFPKRKKWFSIVESKKYVRIYFLGIRIFKKSKKKKIVK